MFVHIAVSNENDCMAVLKSAGINIFTESVTLPLLFGLGYLLVCKGLCPILPAIEVCNAQQTYFPEYPF